jgi:hypothetical protein
LKATRPAQDTRPDASTSVGMTRGAAGFIRARSAVIPTSVEGSHAPPTRPAQDTRPDASAAVGMTREALGCIHTHPVVIPTNVEGSHAPYSLSRRHKTRRPVPELMRKCHVACNRIHGPDAFVRPVFAIGLEVVPREVDRGLRSFLRPLEPAAPVAELSQRLGQPGE